MQMVAQQKKYYSLLTETTLASISSKNLFTSRLTPSCILILTSSSSEDHFLEKKTILNAYYVKSAINIVIKVVTIRSVNMNCRRHNFF